MRLAGSPTRGDRSIVWSAVVVCASLTLAACGQAQSREGVRSGSEARESAQAWTRIPPGPLSARPGAVAVTVGQEVLVLGGTDAPPCPPNADCAGPSEPALRDGAAYSPGARTWRTISDAPAPLLWPRTAVADGVVYLLASEQVIGQPGGGDDIAPALLAYSVAGDSWSALPFPPGGGASDIVAVPASSARGAAVLAYPGSHENGHRPDQVYDVETKSWSEVPIDPIEPSFDRRMVVTDRGDVVLLGIDSVADPGVRPALYRAALWRPGEKAWEELPRSEVVGYDQMWWWSDGRVVNASGERIDGGQTNNYGRAYPSGGLLDPYERAWTVLPNRPPPVFGVTWYVGAAGDGVVVAGGWALNVATARWTKVPVDDELPQQEAAVSAVDGRLFVWGGARFDRSEPLGELVADGWTWPLPAGG